MSTVTSVLTEACIATGRAVVHAISALPLAQRASRAPSKLKPPPGEAALPDVVGEEAAWGVLQTLATELGLEVRVIVDTSTYHAFRPAVRQPAAPEQRAIATAPRVGQHLWVFLDAVDGTIKLAGLGNQTGRLRAANDGAWAVGVAFSHPTDLALDELHLSDFKVAAIIDASVCHDAPDPLRSHPGVVVAAWADAAAVADTPPGGSATLPPGEPSAATAGIARPQDLQSFGEYRTFEGSLLGARLWTTTNTTLGQAFVFLDAFQAYDRKSAQPGDEALAASLHAALMNRNEGGAFDVLRSYGNLAALQRTMLGWRHGPAASSVADAEASASTTDIWLEAQCGSFLVVNENLPNLIPALPIILGAGGIATDFDGQPLTQRKLISGRCNTLYAANAELHKTLLDVIARIRRMRDLD